MKKFIGILAFAAIAFIGCTEKDGSESTTLPTPPAQEDHATIGFQESPVLPSPSGDETTDNLHSLTISSGGHGIAEFQEAGPVGFQLDNPTRAPRLGGKFFIKNVGEFTLLDIEDRTLVLPPKGSIPNLFAKIGFKSAKGGDEREFYGYLLDEPYAGCVLCRDWSVDEIFLSLDGDRAGKTFKGCNINEISKYLIEKGVKIVEQPASYTVDKILLAESGKFGILFTGEKPYFGNFTLADNGEFSYSLESWNEDDPIIAGTATGSFTVVKGRKGRLALNASLTGSDGKPYKIEMVLFLLPS